MNQSVQDVLIKDLMQLMGLSKLSEKEQAELYQQAMETVQNRLLIRIATILGEKNKDEFFKLIDKGDEKAVDDYLKSKKIDYQTLFTEEVLLYKLEMSHKSQSVK